MYVCSMASSQKWLQCRWLDVNSLRFGLPAIFSFLTHVLYKKNKSVIHSGLSYYNPFSTSRFELQTIKKSFKSVIVITATPLQKKHHFEIITFIVSRFAWSFGGRTLQWAATLVIVNQFLWILECVLSS